MTPEALDSLRPSAESQLPLSRQLYLSLYNAISRGHFNENQTLPPSRQLATQLGLGRNTVINVYSQLCDEGLQKSDGRRGTMVCHTPQTTEPGCEYADEQSNPRAWPLAPRAVLFQHDTSRPAALSPDQPDASLFPKAAWNRPVNLSMVTDSGPEFTSNCRAGRIG